MSKRYRIRKKARELLRQELTFDPNGDVLEQEEAVNQILVTVPDDETWLAQPTYGEKEMSKHKTILDLVQPILDGEVSGIKGLSAGTLSIMPASMRGPDTAPPATAADWAGAAPAILPGGVAHLVAGADQPQPAQTSHVIMPGFGRTWNAALAANKQRTERVAAEEAAQREKTRFREYRAWDDPVPGDLQSHYERHG